MMENCTPLFENVIQQVAHHAPLPAAIVYPLSEVALQGTVLAAKRGLIVPHLIGPRKEIETLAAQLGLDLAGSLFTDTQDAVSAAQQAVELCAQGTCSVLVKGSLHSDTFLSPAVRSANGLVEPGKRISHLFLVDSPSYPRPLLLTDAAVNIAPNLEVKASILQNAIDAAHRLGLSQPRVAILSAVETVNPHIQSTLDAAALSKMADRGQIQGGIVDGPLALDDALSVEVANIKGIHSAVAGQADVLVVPDLDAGNMVAKEFELIQQAEMAGIVLGARVPIVLTGRADTARTRLASIAIAVLFAATTTLQPYSAS